MRRTHRIASCCAFLLLVMPRTGLAQVPEDASQMARNGASGTSDRFKNYDMRIQARSGRPVIDGVLDDGEWDAAMQVGSFVQFRPDPGEAATESTTAWVLYDEDALYVGFHCVQRNVPIQDYVARRDHLPGDPDWAAILIDPFMTWKEAYFFMVNPAGIQQDGTLGPDGNGDASWDAVWRSAAHRVPDGWTAEMAIPWSSLRFPHEDRQTWGVNFLRSLGERSELSTWAPLDVGGNSLIASNGLMEGVQGVVPGRAIQVDPYFTARQAREGRDDGASAPDWVGEQGLRYMGADLRAGLASNLVLDLTVNPDFGHIEADQEQVNFSPYELFFEEKRPFFMEGQQIFGMPINLFYSRRIHNPLVGAKLTGQVGGTQVGLISAFDEPLGGYDETPYRTQSVVRLKQNVGTASYIGGVVASQDMPDQERRGAGYQRNVAADFDLRPSDSFNVSGMVALTSAPGLSRRNAAYHLAATYSSRTIVGSFRYTDAQPRFDAVMGYIQRPGQQSFVTDNGYRIEADLGPIKWMIPFIYGERYQDSSTGELADQAGVTGFNLQLRDNGFIAVRRILWQVREGGVTWDGQASHFEYSANRSGTWNGHVGFRVGDGFDYGDFDLPGDERLVFSGSYWGGVTWRPGPRAALGLNGQYVRRSRYYSAPTIDDVRIAGLTGQYQFTRELFGRLNLQARWNHLGQDGPSPEKGRRLLLNALLGFELGPGSVIYLAYNHYDYGRLLETGEPDRVLFLKVARLFAL